MNKILIRRLQMFLDKKMGIIFSIMGLLCGIIFSVLFVFKNKNPHLLTFGLAGIASSLLYLSFFKNSSIDGVHFLSFAQRCVTEILFFLLFSSSLLVVLFDGTRSVSYFTLVSICIGLIAVSILYSKGKFMKLLNLFKIFLLSFNLKYVIFFFFGGIPGIDSWYHILMSNILANQGSTIWVWSKEAYYPMMHTLVATSQLILNLPTKESSFISLVFASTIVTIFVYLLGKLLFSPKIGLLATLLVNICDWNLFFSSSPQTITMGWVLFCIILYLIFRLSKGKALSSTQIILFIVVVGLVITSAVVYFIFSVTLLAIVLCKYIYPIVFPHSLSEDRKKLVHFFIFSVVIFVQHMLMFSINEKHNSFFEFCVAYFYNHVQSDMGFLSRPESLPNYFTIANISPLENFIDTVGLLAILILAFCGIYAIVSSKYRTPNRFTLAIVLLLLLSLSLGTSFVGLDILQPSRWSYFEYILLAIISAFIIDLMSHQINPRIASITLIFVLVAFIGFFMICATVSNTDNPLWLEESTRQTLFTYSQIKGGDTILKMSDTVISEPYFRNTALWYTDQSYGLNRKIYPIGEVDNKFNLGVFVWNDYLSDRPVTFECEVTGFDGFVMRRQVLGSYFRTNIDQNLDKIYSTTDQAGYFITNQKLEYIYI